MKRYKLLCIILILIPVCFGLTCLPGLSEPFYYNNSQQDPLKENQILYNGKEWHNIYSNIKGDQFLFSSVYLPGSLTMNGKTFKNVNLSYDIYSDEIITPTNYGVILNLNKEMVDSFSLTFGFKTYRFINTDEDSLDGIKGYVNVLYKNKTSLYVKYKKEIQLLAVDDKYDLFYQTYRIYLLKDGIIHQLTNKKELLKVLYKNKDQIKDFIKKNRLRISRKLPESFIPVIRYYDSISQ